MPKLRVLVVDDEPGMRESLHDVLDLAGFQVETAGDGVEALEELRKSRSEDAGGAAEMEFDAVVMDIVMPRMNGVEAFKEMQSRHPQTSVILMTGYSAFGLIDEAEKSGCRHILTKPLDIPKLLVLLPQLPLRGNGSTPPDPATPARVSLMAALEDGVPG